MSGAGSADIRIDKLEEAVFGVDLSGSGNISLLSGEIRGKQKVEISGSGSYDSALLPSKSTCINISGSGNVSVQAVETLDVHISGSGKVRNKGTPTTIKKTISGSGRLIYG